MSRRLLAADVRLAIEERTDSFIEFISQLSAKEKAVMLKSRASALEWFALGIVAFINCCPARRRMPKSKRLLFQKGEPQA